MFTSKKMISATLLSGAVLLSAATLSFGQSYYPQYVPTYSATPAPPVQPYINQQPQALPADQLDQLLAPIALYPDPLLAQVLAASTYPQDVASAAQWLQTYPNPSEDDINAQPWDPSVKALVHFPNVLNMLASQMDWTEALGNAFANQQQDVMDSVQHLRAQAQQANTLATNQEEQVVTDNGEIEILPAQPDVIYVPTYDPYAVYAPGGYVDWDLSFPIGGTWFDLGWDWHNHRIDRDYHWDSHDWHNPHVDRNPSTWTHDRSRPIPAPRYVNPRPHGAEPARGWDNSNNHRPAPAFDSHNPPRNNNGNNNHPTMRPVNGFTPHPAPTPHVAPTPAPAPHIEAPHFTPPHPQPVVHPTPQPTQRAVIGLPQHPTVQPHPEPIVHPPAPPVVHAPPPQPVVHEAPPPVIHPAPAPVVHPAPPPAPVIHAAPAPAFHMEPSANVHVESSRGGASISASHTGGGGGGSDAGHKR